MNQPNQTEVPTEALITELPGVRLLKPIPVVLTIPHPLRHAANIKGLEDMFEAWGESNKEALDALKRGIVREFGNLEDYERRGEHPYNHSMETFKPIKEYVRRS